jgi:hypothetical protein
MRTAQLVCCVDQHNQTSLIWNSQQPQCKHQGATPSRTKQVHLASQNEKPLSRQRPSQNQCLTATKWTLTKPRRKSRTATKRPPPRPMRQTTRRTRMRVQRLQYEKNHLRRSGPAQWHKFQKRIHRVKATHHQSVSCRSVGRRREVNSPRSSRRLHQMMMMMMRIRVTRSCSSFGAQGGTSNAYEHSCTVADAEDAQRTWRWLLDDWERTVLDVVENCMRLTGLQQVFSKDI